MKEQGKRGNEKKGEKGIGEREQIERIMTKVGRTDRRREQVMRDGGIDR